MRSIVVFAIGFSLAVAVPAAAVELRPIEVRKGTDGLVPVPLTVSNATSRPIVCMAEIAHWYSAELGRAIAGADALIGLWRDPSDGAFVALNDSEENLPVEKLWCGFEGRSYETRSELMLDRGAPSAARAIVCRESQDRLVCG
jgi:hypothetical protein